MFRKTDKTASQPEATPAGPGKGHATPSRKEAQAAARQRARSGRDPKATAKAQRQRRYEQSARQREGMKRGEEKYLFARDQGPVRRFIRDWVDSRITVIELFLPILIVIMGLQLSGSQRLLEAANLIWSVAWLVLIIDIVWIFFRLGRELRRRFPDADTKGWRLYALMRALQFRPMRVPKANVKLFQPLPEHYR